MSKANSFSIQETGSSLDYDKFKLGQEVSFKVRFNRKDPVAVDVKTT